MKPSAAIEIEHVWKFYGDYPALRDYTLSIGQRSCCALLGRNGAGKTTILRILAGLSSHQRGTVRILGASPRGSEIRRSVGFLGHGIGVYEDLSARENLLFFARIVGLENRCRTVDGWLERVGLARVASMRVLRLALTVAYKELALALRIGVSRITPGSLRIALLCLILFVSHQFSDVVRVIAGGLLWVVFTFSGALVFNHGFSPELPNVCLD